MDDWNSIWDSVDGVWSEGTPNSDSGVFPNGVNKGRGQGGKDHIRGNSSANVILGDGGDDLLRGDGGDDSLNGGTGNDILLGDELNDPDPGDDLIEGDRGNDLLIGDGGNDVLKGGADDDILLGGDGRDALNGGDGNDALIGGNDDDTLNGDDGDDILTGNLGDDVLRGGLGIDWISGGRGEDSLYGGGGNDALCGNSGHDYLNGGGGHDFVSGGSGDDVLRGGNGRDTLIGGADDDVLLGGRGHDLIHGDTTIPGLHGGGHDNIQGGSGDDTIYGGDGDDRIEGNDNSDYIDGGAGDDRIWGDNASGKPASDEASDMIDGGSGNDTIDAGEDDDLVRGSDGDDEITGGAGNDTMRGDAGDDVIGGGDGNDHLSGDGGNDKLFGDAGDDRLSGGDNHDRLFGGDGDDCLDGGGGRDTLEGGDGDDRLSGGGYHDRLVGDRGNDMLRGDGGNDTLAGGANEDTLRGGDGDDFLHGGSGSDLLLGGAGADTLRGGAGGDDFAFGYGVDTDGDGTCDEEVLAVGNDRIVDFSANNNDRILIHSALAGIGGSNLAATISGADVIVEILSTGETITIVGLVNDLEGIDPDDPLFMPGNLMPMLLKTGKDDDGKGIITISDVCVGDFACIVDLPEIGWTAPRIVDPEAKRVLLADDSVGNTLIETSQQEMASVHVEDDANVTNEGDALLFTICASNPPTIDATDPVGFIEAIDASAQHLFQTGTIFFDDVDETDTIALSFGNNAIPVWSTGLSLDLVDPTLFQALIDGFSFPETIDVDPPGSVPWTYDLTANLDFLALGESISWAYEIFVIDSEGTQSSDIIEFTITGTNDAPTIEVTNDGVPNETAFLENGDASAQSLTYIIDFDSDDLDYTDEVNFTFASNGDIAWSDGALDSTLAAILEFGSAVDGFTTIPTPGPLPVPSAYTLTSAPVGPVNLDFLGEGETITWSYTVTVIDPHGATDTDVSNFLITGTNDRPEAQDLAFTLSEDDSSAPVDDAANVNGYGLLTGTALTQSFVFSDDDVNDTHTVEIVGLTEISPGVYQTVDNEGFSYGKLTNNGDGTFTFDPEDDFQHLKEGESRTVTFQYQVRDDSGAGETPASPSESELSELRTVTLTIEGEDDADQIETDTLTFITQNQSIWNTGQAFVFDPKLPFLGFDTGNVSLNATIIADQTFSGPVLEGILAGIESIANFFTGLGCDIVNFFGGDCDDVEVDLPSEITIPGISTTGFIDAKVGVQPYFFFNAGDVDAEIPVDVVFVAPRQVEQGESFIVESAFTVDGGASFETVGPEVKFGLDFVLDLAGNLVLDLFDTLVTIIPAFDTSTIEGFEGELGEPGFNIFNVENGNAVTIPLPLNSTVTLTIPELEAEGEPINAPLNTVLEGQATDEIAQLNLDLDAAAAALINALTGVPIKFGDDPPPIGVPPITIAGQSLNLISFDYEWDLIAVNLLTTINAIQDFTLTVKDLPLKARLEDGSVIDGFSVGDNITVEVPEGSLFDVDFDGDGDGLMDFNIEIDMEAVFENITSLGLDLDLFVGLLRFVGSITSDFFPDVEISLFDGLIPSIDGNDDEFLFGRTFNLVDNAPLGPPLFEDEFDLVGWNNPQPTGFEFDVA